MEELLKKLKQYEGKRVYFKYRGKIRPFILQAVQDVEPESGKYARGRYSSYYGEVRLDYDYPAKNREWDGFWTKRIEDVSFENEAEN